MAPSRSSDQEGKEENQADLEAAAEGTSGRGHGRLGGERFSVRNYRRRCGSQHISCPHSELARAHIKFASKGAHNMQHWIVQM